MLSANASSIHRNETIYLNIASRERDPRTIFDKRRVTSHYLPENIEEFKRWALTPPHDIYLNQDTAFLDLHGYGCKQAKVVIEEFLTKCFLLGIDQTFIMTGKGRHSENERNVLRSKLPGWLKSLSKKADFETNIDLRYTPPAGEHVNIEPKQLTPQEQRTIEIVYYFGGNRKGKGNRHVNKHFAGYVDKKLKGRSANRATKWLKTHEVTN